MKQYKNSLKKSGFLTNIYKIKKEKGKKYIIITCLQIEIKYK